MQRKSSPPKVDIHTHVAFPEVLALTKLIKLKGNEPGKQHWVSKSSLKRHAVQSSYSSESLYRQKPRLKDMDTMGIDMQAISMTYPRRVIGRTARPARKLLVSVTKALQNSFRDTSTVLLV